MMSLYTRYTIAICTIALVLAHTSSTFAQSVSPRISVEPSSSARSSASPSVTANPSSQPSVSPRARNSGTPSPSSSAISTEISNRREALTSQRSDSVRDLTKRMIMRLEAAQTRQENLLGRMDSRIGKLKELKANTSALDRQVTSLEQTLTQQAALIAAITPNLDKALSDINSTEYFNAFKDSSKKAVAQITTTQSALNKLLEEIKALSSRTSPVPTVSGSPRDSSTPTASGTSRPSVSPSPRTSAEE